MMYGCRNNKWGNMVSSLARRVLRAEALCHTRWYSQPPHYKNYTMLHGEIYIHTH